MHLVVCAPAGPAEPEDVARGVAAARARGFEVTVLDGTFRARGYLAGSDQERLADLQQAIALGDAVWPARGGYGCSRIVDLVDWVGCRGLIGFSDITTLHLAALRHGVPGLVHGPGAAVPEGRIDEAAWDRWAAVIRGRSERLTGGETLAGGRGRGPLVGGNLSLLVTALGTVDAAPLHGAVLLLEEVREAPYKIDRMLTQLQRAGVFGRAAGVVVGGLTDCRNPGRAGPTAHEVVAERLGNLPIPVVGGWELGHGVGQQSVPLGVMVELDADAGTLSRC